MKLRLTTQNTEVLKSCFSQINALRKHVILRFSPEQLLAISVNSSALYQEPQVWCKFPMSSIFSDVKIQSIRDNVISLEVNIELFIQTLRDFDKADGSTELHMRLQRKEGQTNTRAAYLALYYVSENKARINHSSVIPVKIFKDEGEILKEPELPQIDLVIRLSNEFSALYRRLERFKNTASHERVTIQASRRNGGSLKFVLQEEDSCSTSIKWNDKLDVQRPSSSYSTDSLRATALRDLPEGVDDDDESEDVSVSVNLKDWCSAAKIVSTCKTVIFCMCDNHACVIHCLLDDTDEAEVIFYISGVRSSDLDSD